ncbi:MAG: alpha/beta hydrolase [Lachnospiraceae bacterium]|nr:alpha/beta hydrolase [Lachnospiraceae bacterium]
MNDIVLIHGAYHGTWCWDDKFLEAFKEKGYQTHCPDLRTVSMEEEQDTLLQTYVENLLRLVRTMEDSPVLVVHSAYSIVVLEYLKKYSETVEAVVFISPLPTRLEFPRVLSSGIRQLRMGLKKVFFSDRLSDQMTKMYLQKLCTEKGGFAIETSKNHWKKTDKFPVPALLMGSENDNCVKWRWVKETAKRLGSDCIIYEDICHDMMLDPSAVKVAGDIICFIKNVKGEKDKNHGEASAVC